MRQQLQAVVDRYVSPGLDAPVRLDFLGEVPADAAVREAVIKRQLLLEAMPGTPAAVAVAGCRRQASSNERRMDQGRRPPVRARRAARPACAPSSTISTT